MDESVAIKVDNVSKTFKLPHEKTTSLKSLLINFRKRRTFELQEALKEVSFEVKKGEFFGIVGRNGSGKSTLLKLLAGIYTPTSGQIQVNGQLTPFIELGVGFSPELTGRENVFLNGALLGFNRTQMDGMYESIVKFAEIERFMDQKLKNYSSGMQVRLAFSIAIRANTDILILDEVLAVGDESFQKKCLDYFRKLKKQHQTVVLVSHDMKTVEKFCDRAILIDSGELIHEGNAQIISAEYSQLNLTNDTAPISQDSEPTSAKILDVKINGKKSLIMHKHELLELEITYKALKDVPVAPSMSVIKSDGNFLANFNTRGDDNIKITKAGETKKLVCKFKSDQFLAGTYGVAVAIYEGEIYLDRSYNAVQFTIAMAEDTKKQGSFNLDGSWHFY
ncbi:MAG TPA: ABC transporter ATP-binding protein [Candidatus Saccharimonadales bacterium]|nr:ABC transporter ATP-binding protein [Candidatus Saccharimonadales bacterium]